MNEKFLLVCSLLNEKDKYSHLLCIFTLFYVEDKHVPASESTGHHFVKENKTKQK